MKLKLILPSPMPSFTLMDINFHLRNRNEKGGRKINFVRKGIIAKIIKELEDETSELTFSKKSG